MNSAEFRESLREIGPLLPVISCGGQVIDGERREKISAEVGRRAPRIELAPAEALRALWILHPDRAIDRAGKRGLEDYARAFGVRPLTVAKYFQQQRITAPAVPAGELDQGAARSRLVQFFVSPRMHFLATAASRELGVNLSAFIREAIATHIIRTLGVQAPDLAADGRSAARKPRTIAGVQHRPAQDTPDGRTRSGRK
jgi:hypothetical protein